MLTHTDGFPIISLATARRRREGIVLGVIDVLVKFPDGGEAAQENEGQSRDDDGVVGLHPKEGL